MQLSSLSHLRTFSSFQKESTCILAITLPPLNPSSQQPLIYFLSIDLLILDISYKWNYTLGGLL